MKSNHASWQVKNLKYCEEKVKGSHYKLKTFHDSEALNQIRKSFKPMHIAKFSSSCDVPSCLQFSLTFFFCCRSNLLTPRTHSNLLQLDFMFSDLSFGKSIQLTCNGHLKCIQQKFIANLQGLCVLNIFNLYPLGL